MQQIFPLAIWNEKENNPGRGLGVKSKKGYDFVSTHCDLPVPVILGSLLQARQLNTPATDIIV